MLSLTNERTVGSDGDDGGDSVEEYRQGQQDGHSYNCHQVRKHFIHFAWPQSHSLTVSESVIIVTEA